MQYIEEGMCYGKIALHIQSPKKFTRLKCMHLPNSQTITINQSTKLNQLFVTIPKWKREKIII